MARTEQASQSKTESAGDDGNSGHNENDDRDPLSSLSTLQTGDILLYRTRDLGARFNSVVGGSFYSHVSLVVRADPGVLEGMYPGDYKNSDPERTGIAIFEAEPRRGVAVFPLVARLARTVKNVEHLAVRRHAGELTDRNRADLLEFMRTVLGRKLEIGSFDILRAVVFNRCRCNLSKQRGRDWNEFFCSELVAEGMMQLGVIRSDDRVKSNLLIPASFDNPRKRRRSAAFDFLDDDRICLPGHDYGLSEVLIKPGNGLEKALREKKKEMLRAENSRVQNLRESVMKSFRMIKGNSARVSQ